MKPAIVYRFDLDNRNNADCQAVSLGIDGDPIARTNDPGMLLLSAVSRLTHKNLVELGEFDGDAQSVTLWTYPIGSPDPPPTAAYIKWSGLSWTHSLPFDQVQRLEFEGDEVLRVIAGQIVLRVREAGLQALVCGLFCRRPWQGTLYDDQQSEVVSVEGTD